jgi:hypothetical protein
LSSWHTFHLPGKIQASNLIGTGKFIKEKIRLVFCEGLIRLFDPGLCPFAGLEGRFQFILQLLFTGLAQQRAHCWTGFHAQFDQIFSREQGRTNGWLLF